MEWPLLIAVAILSIMWAISTYKWVRAEQKVKELQQDKHGLQLDKLNLKREVGWLKNKDNDQQGIFVVEVNKGIYLVALESDAYKHWKEHGTLINFGSFRFTKDAFKATTYRDLAVAKQNAKSCGGRVLQHKPNLEVVE
ncbi:hypothetical protein GBL57_10485 [Streptococcus equi]|nr:hypothetical protein [Streptococcus equi]